MSYMGMEQGAALGRSYMGMERSYMGIEKVVYGNGAGRSTAGGGGRGGHLRTTTSQKCAAVP